MAGLNKHIKDYLDFYIDMNNSPGYGILLSGEWGCGKTRFIKNIIDERTSGKTDIQFIYLSLYGKRDTEEIDFEIVSELVGLKKPYRNILKSVGSSIFTISSITAVFGKIISGAKKEIKAGISKLKSKSRENYKIVYIFDDMERCQIDIKSVLGYINSYIEHEGAKLILISHEGNLDENADYWEYIEKVIGKKFRIQAEFDEAFNSFLGEVKEETGDILKKYKEHVKKIFTESNFHNLRVLRNAVLSFEHYIKQIPDNIFQIPEGNPQMYGHNISDNDFFATALDTYFNILFTASKTSSNNDKTVPENTDEESTGTKPASRMYDDINNRIYNSDKNIYNKIEEKYIQSKLKSNYTSNTDDVSKRFDKAMYGSPFGIELKYWISTIVYSIDNSDIFNNAHQERKKIKERNELSLFTLLNNPWMPKKKFEPTYKKLLEEIDEGKYTERGEIKHIAHLLYSYIEKEIIDKVNVDFKDIIDKYYTKQNDNVSRRPDTGFGGFGGFAYLGIDNEEYRQEIEKIQKYMEEKDNKQLSSTITNSFRNKNRDLIENLLYRGKYSYKPVLAMITEPNEENFDLEYIHELSYGCRNRYNSSSIQDLKSEIKFWNAIKTIVDNWFNNSSPKMNPQYIIIETTKNQVDNIVKQLKD